MPNGFSDANFPKNPSVKKLNPGEELRIVWHSRVSAEKRMMPFLKALKNVKGKYRLDVFGGGGDFFRAKRFVKRHHMNVKFHGTVNFEKVKSAISSSHLDVLVSYNFDTFGMTLIEAEAYGVPVFFCDPDMQEVVPKGSYVMSKNETPEAMTETLNDLLEHPERIEQMSEVMLKNRSDILISHRIKTLEQILSGIIKK
jgi:glycosyltransferase involved in cell wall biosynthesis